MTTIQSVNRKKSFKRTNIIAWIMVLPALILSIFIMGGPIVGTALLSLTDWDGITTPHFVAFDNFKTLITDSTFRWAVLNNIKWMVYFLIVPIILSLVVAVVLSHITKGRMFFRTAFFIPYIVSTVVLSKIWSLIYSPIYGVPHVLEQMGFKNVLLPLSNTKIALFSVAFVDAWRYWGFLMVLFLTALQQTDKSLEEAGIIDGANRVQIFFHITIPQIRPVLSMMLMLTAIWSFTTFDFVYLMTNGGPGNSTEIISTYMYRLTMQNQMPGYASAISLVMVVFSMVFMGAFSILRKRGWDV